jgi:hypothetical protein
MVNLDSVAALYYAAALAYLVLGVQKLDPRLWDSLMAFLGLN